MDAIQTIIRQSYTAETAVIMQSFDPISVVLEGETGTAPVVYILDTYPARAAYSLRKLKTGVTNCVRVRRSSDDTELDIGFVDDYFDVAAFSTFIGGGSGFVKTFYDQSGNGFDLTQTVNAGQPQLVLDQYGTKEAVKFFNFRYLTRVSNFMSAASAGTMFIAKSLVNDPPLSDPTTGHAVLCSGTATHSHYPYTDGNIYDAWGTTDRKTVGNPATPLTALHLYTVISAANDWRAYVNGTLQFSTGTNTVGFTTDFRMGAQIETHYFDGFVAENIFFDSALSNLDRVAIENNIDDYYTIF